MKRIMKTLTEYLDRKDIHFEEVDDDVLQTGFLGKNGVFDTIISANEEGRTLGIKTIYPIRAQEERRAEVADVLMRANLRLIAGAFYMDMDSGRIVFRTGIRFLENVVDEEVIQELLFLNWAMSDAHFEVVTAVIYGNLSPVAAIEMMKHQKTGDRKETVSRGPKSKDLPNTDRGWGGRLGGFMN